MNNNRKLYFSVVSFVLALSAILVGIFSLTEAQLNVNGSLGYTSHAELAVSSSMCQKIANGFGFTWRSRREAVANSIGGPCCKELSEIEMTECAIKCICANVNRFRQIVKIINKAECYAKANGLNSIDEIIIKEILNDEATDKETVQTAEQV